MPDSYAIDAITVLRRFVRERPHYKETGQFLGGKSNRVLTGSWAGQPVVFKYFGDEDGMHIGSPADRQEREARIMTWLSRAGLGPELIERHRETGISVIARHHGRSLNWVMKSADVIQVGQSFGAMWGQVLQLSLPEDEVAAFVRDCDDGRGREALIAEICDRGAWLLKRSPAEDLAASLQRCREHQEALKCDSPGIGGYPTASSHHQANPCR